MQRVLSLTNFDKKLEGEQATQSIQYAAHMHTVLAVEQRPCKSKRLVQIPKIIECPKGYLGSKNMGIIFPCKNVCPTHPSLVRILRALISGPPDRFDLQEEGENAVCKFTREYAT